MAHTSDHIKVWDPLTRVFHWTLVPAFFTAYVTEDVWLGIHLAAGYTILGLLAFRVVWGMVGPRHARFADFVYRPSEVVAYLRAVAAGHPPRYLGHNPAGGAMVAALLLSLSVTVLSGLAAYGTVEFSGPLAGVLAGMGDEWAGAFERVHEISARASLTLVAVHVTGVVLASVQHGENLVLAMWTGRKRIGGFTTEREEV